MKYILLIITILLNGCFSNPSNTSMQRGSVRPSQPSPTPSQYRQELTLVSRGQYKVKRLIGKEEEGIFWKLIHYCKNKKMKVFAQVSLGEILGAEDNFYKLVNAKRVDFCITDNNFMPIAVIEYQGSGHINETSEERDEIKRVAVENAGIFFISINVGSNNNLNDILDSYFTNYS